MCKPDMSIQKTSRQADTLDRLTDEQTDGRAERHSDNQTHKCIVRLKDRPTQTATQAEKSSETSQKTEKAKAEIRICQIRHETNGAFHLLALQSELVDGVFFILDSTHLEAPPPQS